MKKLSSIIGVSLLTGICSLYAQPPFEKGFKSKKPQFEKAAKTIKKMVKRPVWVKPKDGEPMEVSREYFKYIKNGNDEPFKIPNNSKNKPFLLPFGENTTKILFEGFRHFAKGTLGEYLKELNDEDTLRLVAAIRITNAFWVESALRTLMSDNKFNEYTVRCGTPCKYPGIPTY